MASDEARKLYQEALNAQSRIGGGTEYSADCLDAALAAARAEGAEEKRREVVDFMQGVQCSKGSDAHEKAAARFALACSVLRPPIPEPSELAVELAQELRIRLQMAVPMSPETPLKEVALIVDALLREKGVVK